MKGTITTNNGLLIDLDGTLYHGSNRIEGADRLIALLREAKMPYRYVTNNSTATPTEVADRLTAMGIPALPEEVCTSAQAAAGYIAERSPGASVYIIGENGLYDAMIEVGLKPTDAEADFVVQGLDRSLTYDRAAKAVQYIRGGAAFVMTNPDLLLPSGTGLLPGAGSIGAMLKAASGQDPVVIGKPSAILMDYSLEKLGMAAENTWVVGDNLATDIAAGIAAGCGTALVFTGLTNEQNYERYAEAAGCKPDLICKDLNELIAVINGSRPS
ncbi:TIGR01457 family HAD-type hydrolase [Paenibacillus nanensis]|uniref:Acid sugar phosphatase n=1 Tax=Paenibacillus nanensis TaxID=393251 RepID=A0A3A1V1D1_9BACL|nr:TIGR01457 family HAD-type hydrolase [Paenibacillus nanensis]RIX53606.1 TIGR01457 family HAD-type hydrolase [Paenibacillus nanensis]